MAGKMTPEQQELAASNLGLVYFVLSKMNLYRQDEDAYGAGCLGLCKAAARWNKHGLAFSTFACHLIRHEIINYLKREKASSKSCRTQFESLENTLYSNEYGYESIEDQDCLKRLCDKKYSFLSADELTVVQLLAKGYDIKEIAEKLNVCAATIYIIRKSAAKKIMNNERAGQ